VTLLSGTMLQIVDHKSMTKNLMTAIVL